MITTVLLDLDDTILDFHKAEKEALKKAGREDLIGFGPKCLLRPGGKAPARSGEKPVRPKKKTIRNTHRQKNS